MTRLGLVVSGVALAACALAGCEVPFDPRVPSDDGVSLSGYLDATADTQWVRVELFGAVAGTSARPLPVAVTLVDEGGAEAVLDQRVRPTVAGPAHLFWTTADVEPGRPYRLDVEAEVGPATTAVVTPDTTDYSVTVDAGPQTCPAVVTVRGDVDLADVQVVFEVVRRGEVETVRLSRARYVEVDADGTDHVSLYLTDDVQEATRPGDVVLSARLRVSVATDWPVGAGVTLEDVLVEPELGAVDRIAGGVGFVGGVVSEWFAHGGPVPCVRP